MKLLLSLLSFSSLMVGTAQGASLLDTVTDNDNLSSLLNAFEVAGVAILLDLSPNFTLFAPTNAALAKVPAKFFEPKWVVHLRFLLLNHLVEDAIITSDMLANGAVVQTLTDDNVTVSFTSGELSMSGVSFTNANIVQADVMASNGVAHIVDKFFMPQKLTMNLFEVVGSINEFKKLTELVVAVGVESEVTADARTILAPTDDAFAALPPELLASLSSNLALSLRLVRYHVVIGVYPRDSLSDGMELETAGGSKILIKDVGFGRFAQIAFVGVQGDEIAYSVGAHVATNGIAHTMDGVFSVPDPESNFPSAVVTETPVAADPTPSPSVDTATPTRLPLVDTMEPTPSPVVDTTEPTPSPVADTTEPTPSPVADTTEPTPSPVADTTEPTPSPVVNTVKPTSSPMATVTSTLDPAPDPPVVDFEARVVPPTSAETGPVDAPVALPVELPVAVPPTTVDVLVDIATEGPTVTTGAEASSSQSVRLNAILAIFSLVRMAIW